MAPKIKLSEKKQRQVRNTTETCDIVSGVLPVGGRTVVCHTWCLLLCEHRRSEQEGRGPERQ